MVNFMSKEIKDELFRRSVKSDTQVMSEALTVISNLQKQVSVYQELLIEIDKDGLTEDIKRRLFNVVNRIKI